MLSSSRVASGARASSSSGGAGAAAASMPLTRHISRQTLSLPRSSVCRDQRDRAPRRVAAGAAPVVRGAGGSGGLGPEDGESDEDGERRSSSALASSSRKDLPLEARIAADVLGVVHPAQRNLTFSRALEALTSSALEAYCCGWTEADLDRELARAHARERDAPRPEIAASYVVLVWLTAEAAADALSSSTAADGDRDAAASRLSSSLGLYRWSRANAVSETSRKRWGGFARLIVEAYYEKCWAWYPVEELALEMSAAAPTTTDETTAAPPSTSFRSEGGGAETFIFASSPADVAEWARVVYATLDLLGSQGRKRRF